MALVLVNPLAQGGRVRRLLPAIGETLDELTPLPRLLTSESVEQALDILLHEPDGTRVVVVGGDGTFNRLLPALLARPFSIGLVPMGSGNDLARALDLNSQDWRQALADALHGRPRTMDTGLAVWSDASGDTHRTPFASSLTCGFDSTVALRAQQGPLWLRGLPRYLWALLREGPRLRHWSAQGQADGQALPSSPMLFTSVFNTPTYGCGLPAAPHARIDDGRLHWVRAGGFGPLATLRMLPTLMKGAHLGHPQVQHGDFERMDLKGHDELPLAADGEWLGLARKLQVTVQPASLYMVRPDRKR